MRVERVRRWEAPAELPTTECDCFWHRRIFTHVARGHSGDDALPLARLVTRADFPNGDLCWEIEMQVESTLLVVRRSLARSGDGSMTLPVFRAWAEVGGARAVELERANPQMIRRYDLGSAGADPTLIYALPNRAGRLVVWREAWWWRLIDGMDPLIAGGAMCSDVTQVTF